MGLKELIQTDYQNLDLYGISNDLAKRLMKWNEYRKQGIILIDSRNE